MKKMIFIAIIAFLLSPTIFAGWDYVWDNEVEVVAYSGINVDEFSVLAVVEQDNKFHVAIVQSSGVNNKAYEIVCNNKPLYNTAQVPFVGKVVKTARGNLSLDYIVEPVNACRRLIEKDFKTTRQFSI